MDFGDTNFITQNYKDVLAWIESDIERIDETGELNYSITVKYMTEKQYAKLPEWS